MPCLHVPLSRLLRTPTFAGFTCSPPGLPASRPSAPSTRGSVTIPAPTTRTPPAASCDRRMATTTTYAPRHLRHRGAGHGGHLPLGARYHLLSLDGDVPPTMVIPVPRRPASSPPTTAVSPRRPAVCKVNLPYQQDFLLNQSFYTTASRAPPPSVWRSSRRRRLSTASAWDISQFGGWDLRYLRFRPIPTSPGPSSPASSSPS